MTLTPTAFAQATKGPRQAMAWITPSRACNVEPWAVSQPRLLSTTLAASPPARRCGGARESVGQMARERVAVARCGGQAARKNAPDTTAFSLLLVYAGSMASARSGLPKAYVVGWASSGHAMEMRPSSPQLPSAVPASSRLTAVTRLPWGRVATAWSSPSRWRITHPSLVPMTWPRRAQGQGAGANCGRAILRARRTTMSRCAATAVGSFLPKAEKRAAGARL